MKRAVLPIILTLAASPAFASPLGIWRVQDGSVNVRISHCGRNLCGSTNGKPILVAMRPTGANLWTGTISDARSGQQYDGTISLLSANALKVHGCLQGGGFCGDQTWTRVR
jgi:uncharacterized protein (DUF2147 family)